MVNTSQIANRFNKVVITEQPDKEWPLCPEYEGLAQIVDMTELKEYTTEFGTKEKFRFLIELNLPNKDGKNWVITSAPFTPSKYKMSALFKFAGDIGLDASSFTIDQFAGKFIKVVIQHTVPDKNGKVFANIKGSFKAKPEDTFVSTYTPKETATK